MIKGYRNRIDLLPVLAFIVILIGCKKDDNSPSNTVKDIDGNVYQTVTIGTQTWMVENLKTTLYNDGTTIPLVTKSGQWDTMRTPGLCWYNNDPATNKTTYGALYNWQSVNTGKLCPAGWHVPNYDEWTVLIDYLGGPNYANWKLKETGTEHWLDASVVNPNADATNESGFTALPAGQRNNFGKFSDKGAAGYWWSSSEGDKDNSWSWSTHVSGIWIGTWNRPKQHGISVRCLKDN